MAPSDPETVRLQEDARREKNWKRWGPYLSERQWGTVREDYSADGDAWDYLPHDHARSRAYRWGEDGLLGICDRECRLCFALALWNGRDPILKERLFGLTGPEGNHGEDVKEQYYYLDATPTHSYVKALYKYPQAEFPYARLVEENRRRGKDQPEFELPDTGVFDDDRYFDVFAEYAKAAPDDILIRVTVANRGPEPAALHLLPDALVPQHLGVGVHRRGGLLAARAVDSGRRTATVLGATIPASGRFRLTSAVRRRPSRRCSSPRTRPTPSGSSATPNPRPYVKDAFHDYVDRRANATRSTRRGYGTQGGGPLPAGAAAGRRGRRSTPPAAADGEQRRRRPFGDAFDAVFAGAPRRGGRLLRRARRARPLTEDERRVARQAYAGLLWSKQFYHYVVERLARRRPRPAAAAAGAQERAATTTGGTSTTATSSRCPTSGSTPGSRPGTSRSTCCPFATHRPRVRQGAAPAAPARVVHAPQRPAPGLRVRLLRRQPAGARLGLLAGLQDDRPRAASATGCSWSAPSRSC